MVLSQPQSSKPTSGQEDKTINRSAVKPQKIDFTNDSTNNEQKKSSLYNYKWADNKKDKPKIWE